MLWVLVCAVYCYNLKLVAVDHRDDVIRIWENLLR